MKTKSTNLDDKIQLNSIWFRFNIISKLKSIYPHFLNYPRNKRNLVFSLLSKSNKFITSKHISQLYIWEVHWTTLKVSSLKSIMIEKSNRREGERKVREEWKREKEERACACEQYIGFVVQKLFACWLCNSSNFIKSDIKVWKYHYRLVSNRSEQRQNDPYNKPHLVWD